MGGSSSRPAPAAPPPPGFDPATGQYAQPIVYQQPAHHHPYYGAPYYGAPYPAPVPPQHGGLPPPVAAAPPPPGAAAAFPVGAAYPAPPPAPPPPARAAEVSQTATIRNAVNLKKPTLTLTPTPDGGALAVSFAFDASAAAAVTVFWGVAEDGAAGCALAQADGASPALPTAAAIYGAGMGHTFPPADAAAARAAGALVDAAAARALAAGPPAAGGRHALVVRLEAVPGAADEAAAKKTLAALTPGAPHAPGVQSQTTFAALEPDAAAPAGFTLRVLKQKIWVAGVSYELQEIYGMESAARAAAARAGAAAGAATATTATAGKDAAVAAGAVAAAAAAATTPTPTPPPVTDEERLCVICLDADRDTTVLPCRHMCMCAPCARALRHQSPRCPICRDTVESLLHIRLGGRAAAGGPAAAPALPVAAEGGAGGEQAAAV